MVFEEKRVGGLSHVPFVIIGEHTEKNVFSNSLLNPLSLTMRFTQQNAGEIISIGDDIDVHGY
jgi:hypothetical protein